MKIHWVALAIVVLLNLLIDWLIFRWLRRKGHRRLAAVHAVVAVAMQGVLVYGMSQPFGDAYASDNQLARAMWTLWIYFTIYIPKIIGSLVALPSLLPLGRGGKRFFTGLSLTIGVAIFALMWWGTLVTPYKTEVNEVSLNAPHLGAAFDGYRIVHISDLHLGTYNGDTAFVAQVVDQINALKPNVVCFTGDLVSRRTSEAEPYRTVLARLNATDGVIAILGNHDYDDYCRWNTEAEKRADRQALCRLQAQCGWRLLLNEPHVIARDTDSLLFIGAENYGEGHFTNYCDMGKAYPDSLHHMPYKILLQHNPVQWRENVLPDTDIDLTLSGHTHAMQIIVSAFGCRWSPAKVRYKEWGGHYTESNQHLYVNIGIGMVGVPMRIGATPEITLITLHRQQP